MGPGMKVGRCCVSGVLLQGLDEMNDKVNCGGNPKEIPTEIIERMQRAVFPGGGRSFGRVFRKIANFRQRPAGSPGSLRPKGGLLRWRRAFFGRFGRPLFFWLAVWVVSAGASAQAQSPGAAATQTGAADNWQMGLQTPVTPVARDMYVFHNSILMPVVAFVSLLVLCLLAFVCIRFSAKRNPEPASWAHNVRLELVWTSIPALTLVVIAVFSFQLLAKIDRIPEADMTLKVVGHQWYWSYEYPDHGQLAFDAFLVPEEDLKPGQLRLMTTDNEVVLPINQTVRLTLTASDVLHSWAVPSLGVRMDTVPGQLNETWVRIEHEGVYYGFCSELCGANHAYMPIMIRAVSPEAFAAWVLEASETLASTGGGGGRRP